MTNLETTLYDLVKPMVDDESKLVVKEMESLNENEVVLYVYAPDKDLAKLIGRQGMMASALNQVMGVASHLKNKRITIKFESI